MKSKYFLVLFVLLSLNNFSYSEEIDCKQFEKFSAKYIECNTKKLKKKIEKTDAKKKLNKFKNSKTLSDLIKN